MSHQARIMFGYTLLTVPTIVYGGLTLLGVVTHGELGAPAPQALTEAQRALYRAGHAHAGVLLILSLLLQLALDHARLSRSLIAVLRWVAPLSAVLVSGGFFGIAHVPALVILLYLGVACVIAATMLTGIGLVRGDGAGHVA